jgi:hypothetical protein
MDHIDKQDLINLVKETLDMIEAQIDVLEHQTFHQTHGRVRDMRLSDGSWPIIPLLSAKAQALNALAVLVTS